MTESQIDVMDVIAPCYYPVHSDIRNERHTFYNFPGGRGSAKSSFCAIELLIGIMRDASKKANALVIRKYAVTLRGSVFSQIQWAIDMLGVSHLWESTINPMQFRFVTGQVIRLAGLDDASKLKSIKPTKGYFKYLWIEEFSEICGELELRNLQQSVLRGGNKFIVFRSFNPPISRSNWANEFVAQDDRALTFYTDYTMIPAEWLGETFLTEAERLKTINFKAYEHEYLGKAVGNGSEVFPNLEIREITDEEIENMNYIYQGIDFGFAADPAVFIRLSYDRKKEIIYFLDELFVKGWSNAAMADWIKDKGYDEYLVTCDSAEPKSIADLRDCGLVTRGCFKRPGAVLYRIKWLQKRKIVIDRRRTPKSCKEFENYSYVTDKRGEVLSQVPDIDNHSIDATGYALDSLIWSRTSTA